MTTGGVSPRRADTRRNHERILAAALAVLTESGDVSFNAIAKRAQVGVGTVYRHFATPDALVLAVYRNEVQHLVDVVPVLLKAHAPERAFHEWTDHLARYMATKRGLGDALRAVAIAQKDLFTASYEAMLRAVTTLLEANIEAGTVRADLEPVTVLRALAAILLSNPDEDWRHLTDLLWRGMHA
jgi:AcrR family transcriptional regulator